MSINHISSHIFWFINDNKLRVSISVLIFPYPTISHQSSILSRFDLMSLFKARRQVRLERLCTLHQVQQNSMAKLANPMANNVGLPGGIYDIIYTVLYTVYIYIYTILSRVSVHFMVIYGWISIFTYIQYIYFLGSYYSYIASKNTGFPTKDRPMTEKPKKNSPSTWYFNHVFIFLAWSLVKNYVYIAVPCQMSIWKL